MASLDVLSEQILIMLEAQKGQRGISRTAELKLYEHSVRTTVTLSIFIC